MECADIAISFQSHWGRKCCCHAHFTIKCAWKCSQSSALRCLLVATRTVPEASRCKHKLTWSRFQSPSSTIYASSERAGIEASLVVIIIIILYFTNSAKKDTFMSIKMYHTRKEHADDRLGIIYISRGWVLETKLPIQQTTFLQAYSVVWNPLSLWDLSQLFWGYNCVE